MSTFEKPKKTGKSVKGGRTRVKAMKTGDVTSISEFTGSVDKSRFNVKKVKSR